jgi:hypothetical protein
MRTALSASSWNPMAEFPYGSLRRAEHLGHGIEEWSCNGVSAQLTLGARFGSTFRKESRSVIRDLFMGNDIVAAGFNAPDGRVVIAISVQPIGKSADCGADHCAKDRSRYREEEIGDRRLDPAGESEHRPERDPDGSSREKTVEDPTSQTEWSLDVFHKHQIAPDNRKSTNQELLADKVINRALSVVVCRIADDRAPFAVVVQQTHMALRVS